MIDITFDEIGEHIEKGDLKEWLNELRIVDAIKHLRTDEQQTRTDEDGRVWEYRNGNWWALGKTEPQINASQHVQHVESVEQIVAKQTDCPWK